MVSTEQPRWRGINHLALITTDMDRTVRFYQGVLGAKLVATIGTPARSGASFSAQVVRNGLCDRIRVTWP